MKDVSEVGKACIDHDHETGEVRGILCRNCNLVLGLIMENSDILRKLLGYINTFKVLKRMRKSIPAFVIEELT